MPIDARLRSVLPGPGPYLARITNLLDPTYMGSVEVVLEKGYLPGNDLQSQTYVVQYLTPFYGITNVAFEGNNPAEFDDVQKSYGMWFVPPDVGTRVLVIFIDGDVNQGYWIGCIPDRFQNHMIPGIAASQNVHLSPEQELKYGTKLLPVAEFHKKSEKDQFSPNSIKKPVHPFADRLLAQGLLLDTVRGVTSSSARREVPSSVFGISTPGPIDPAGKKRQLGYSDSKLSAPVSRLGGTQFVMDDGDESGQNELVRLRTRTGHQILMHNSHDLIYIANSKGTAWIELTSNGKIDIFAEDSVSIHTENDFNFRADRDINFEAGRKVNIKSNSSMNVNVRENLSLIVEQDGKLAFAGDANIYASGDLKIQSAGSANLSSGDAVRITSSSNMNLGAGGTILASGGEIHLNGPAAEAATAPEQPEKLPMYSLPNRSKEVGWANGNFYKAGNITSIMQRVPTHEPWDHHENTNAERFTQEKTDAAVGTTKAARSGEVPTAAEPLPEPNGKQPANWSRDADFIAKVKEVAKKIGADYIDLLACMAFETGRKFDPSLRNFIGATGLIQFVPVAAKQIGTTTDFLATLTRTQQMDWVLKYFQAGPLKKVSSPTLEDLYMSILWPAAVGKPDDYVLFRAGSKQYSQNNGLDADKKGYISKKDAATKVRAQIPYVKQQLANAQG